MGEIVVMSGRGWGIGLLIVALAALGRLSVADAAERVALVIGNSRYDHAPYLNNPERDAQAIAEALSGLGFQVTGPLLNQDKSKMDNVLRQFGRRARSAEAAVVYFSGHGVEVGGKNYLIPKDAVLEREGDASLETVALDVVLDQIGGASRYRLVILDACRDNPLANNMARAKGEKAAYRGLAPVEPGGQTYVAYAARAGQRAQDGAGGGHSPYAAALLKHLPRTGLPLERLFGAVSDEVKRTTSGEQTPLLYGEFGAEPIYLAGLAPAAPASTPSPPAVDHDLIAWQSAEKCGTAACFQAYLDDYPSGRYARMAKARLKPEPSPRPPATASTAPAPEERPPVTASTAPVSMERPRQSFEPEMVRIPGGCFQMGSPASEPDRSDEERQHEVCVKAFEIGVHEVMQGQWRAVMGSNPSRFQQGDDYPVELVSWHDVQTYLKTLNRRTGQSYRLPTEAEWEYACRGGVAGEVYCGGNDLDRLAWYEGNSGHQTHPVGKKAANGFGLYDMSGNVWEWTCSVYDKDYGDAEQKCYKEDIINPLAVRGGAWNFNPDWVRSANRGGVDPTVRAHNRGFRLARSL